MSRIQTFGNRVFVDRAEAEDVTPIKKPRAVAEKVNLKFGKIRVQVTGSKKVRVSQDGTTMIIMLDELSATGQLQQQPKKA